MKEKNKDILQDALGKLSLHQPEEETWDAIENQLSSMKEDDAHPETLKSAISNLPNYTAPNHIWKRIEQTLNAPSRKFSMPRRLAAAVIGLMVLSALGYALFFNSPSIPEEAPVYLSEKKLEDPIQLNQAEIVLYESQMEEVENQLKACLAQIPEPHNPEITAALLDIEILTATRDSLTIILETQQARPGAAPRLKRLELRRQKLIQKLQAELCE